MPVGVGGEDGVSAESPALVPLGQGWVERTVPHHLEILMKKMKHFEEGTGECFTCNPK